MVSQTTFYFSSQNKSRQRATSQDDWIGQTETRWLEERDFKITHTVFRFDSVTLTAWPLGGLILAQIHFQYSRNEPKEDGEDAEAEPPRNDA